MSIFPAEGASPDLLLGLDEAWVLFLVLLFAMIAAKGLESSGIECRCGRVDLSRLRVEEPDQLPYSFRLRKAQVLPENFGWGLTIRAIRIPGIEEDATKSTVPRCM